MLISSQFWGIRKFRSQWLWTPEFVIFRTRQRFRGLSAVLLCINDAFWRSLCAVYGVHVEMEREFMRGKVIQFCRLVHWTELVQDSSSLIADHREAFFVELSMSCSWWYEAVMDVVPDVGVLVLFPEVCGIAVLLMGNKYQGTTYSWDDHVVGRRSQYMWLLN